MKATNLEPGQQVTVSTENGDVIGIVKRYWRFNEKKQFAVEFDNCGIKMQACFSRKTGKPYGDKRLKAYVK